MTRFALAAVAAAALGLGLAGTADAQYVTRYTTITPNGGVVYSGQMYNLGTYQAYNNYVSPFGTVKQQSYYGDVFGNTYGTANAYNPYTGYGYNRGYYNAAPNIYNPYGSYYNYNYHSPYYGYGRRW